MHSSGSILKSAIKRKKTQIKHATMIFGKTRDWKRPRVFRCRKPEAGRINSAEGACAPSMVSKEAYVIYKRCPRCNKRIPEGTTCGCMKREYAPTKAGAEFYHTSRWQKMRAYIISKYNGADVWAKRAGRLEAADTVHHIIPAEENRDLLYSESNLVPVSRASHAEIHALYAESPESKRKTQEILRGIADAMVTNGLDCLLS